MNRRNRRDFLKSSVAVTLGVGMSAQMIPELSAEERNSAHQGAPGVPCRQKETRSSPAETFATRRSGC
jgi:hypothetical protein